MSYDVVVIGAGPGGYVAAIKASQLGLKTAIVEKREALGGTCLNIGCIPSKALLHGSEIFAELNHGFEDIGVEVNKPSLNLANLMKHKKETIDANTAGIAFLMKKNKIDVYHGVGSVISFENITVKNNSGEVKNLHSKSIIIATGSSVAGIPGLDIEFDEKIILSSTGALALDTVPSKMIVVGGGVIGSELGVVWSRLGAEVTVIEYQNKLLGNTDSEISKHFQKLMEDQGIIYKLGSQVTSIEKTEKGANITYKSVNDSDEQTIAADVVLVATGRLAYSDGLGLEEIGIVKDKYGRIEVNSNWQTNVPNIYAIGDVIKGPMLAHKAEDEGVAVAEILAGQKGHVNYDVIPSVVYTQPEVASVGKTEEELKAQGISYNIGKFYFSANGRARAMNKTAGFVKILADKSTDKLLGGHIIGFGAGEMIHEIAVLMEFGGSSEDLARTCHSHPTMSEAVKEAALAAFFKPIHA